MCKGIVRPVFYRHLQRGLRSITIPEEPPRAFGFELATDSASCSLPGSFSWIGKAERGSGSGSHSCTPLEVQAEQTYLDKMTI